MSQQIRVQKSIAIIESHSGSATPTNWLSNLLPAGKEDMMIESSADNTPIVTPSHQAPVPLQSPFGHQKPVNLLSEALHQPGRKLSEREQRDCEVIGMLFSFIRKCRQAKLIDCDFCFRATHQNLLLHRPKIDPRFCPQSCDALPGQPRQGQLAIRTSYSSLPTRSNRFTSL